MRDFIVETAKKQTQEVLKELAALLKLLRAAEEEILNNELSMPRVLTGDEVKNLDRYFLYLDTTMPLEYNDKGEAKVYMTTRVPDKVHYQYNRWYQKSVLLADAYMRPLLEKLTHTNELCMGTTASGLTGWLALALRSGRIGLKSVQEIIKELDEVKAQVELVPYNVKIENFKVYLANVQSYVSDQIEEAYTLLHVGHSRAAGAVAGVVLERHLKILCAREVTPLPRDYKGYLGQTIEQLTKVGFFNALEEAELRDMKEMRNSCDHSDFVSSGQPVPIDTAEPDPVKVKELIDKAKEYIGRYPA